MPAGSAVVLSMATPPAFSELDPRIADPLVKVTIPPGVPEAEVTVAVKVTLDP